MSDDEMYRKIKKDLEKMLWYSAGISSWVKKNERTRIMQTYSYEVLVPQVYHRDADGKVIVDRPAKRVVHVEGLLKDPGDQPSDKLDIAQSHYKEVMAAGTEAHPVKLSEVIVNVRPFRG